MTQEPQKNVVLIVIAIIGVVGTIVASGIGAYVNYNIEKERQGFELTRIALVSIVTQGEATQVSMASTISAPTDTPYPTNTPLPTFTPYPTYTAVPTNTPQIVPTSCSHFQISSTPTIIPVGMWAVTRTCSPAQIACFYAIEQSSGGEYSSNEHNGNADRRWVNAFCSEAEAKSFANTDAKAMLEWWQNTQQNPFP